MAKEKVNKILFLISEKEKQEIKGRAVKLGLKFNAYAKMCLFQELNKK